jgi:hypothetical protein
MFRSQLSLILRGIVVVAAVASYCGAASAEEDTTSANYVIPGCRHFIERDRIDPILQGWCMGMISGLVYLSDDVCTPSAVVRTQSARVIVQYIEARPARMHEDFKKLALEAMRAAWPCKP